MDFNVVKDLIEDYFNGQFEVKKFLGEGSFAEVYLVNHRYLDDLRAMKIIKEPLRSASSTKKVFHEVMLATKLRHENIISIYDAGIISTYGFDGQGKFSLTKNEGIKEDWAYFIMEYVQGGDLEQYRTSFANSNISMPISRALDIVKQILQGLNTLHSSQPPIVHRDLKPNNILLSFDCDGEIVIKISDFGFAKEVSTTDIDVEVAGNKNYMAPECYSKVFSSKTDVYAVGVIFYQILTNHFPFSINEFNLMEVLDNKPWTKPLMPPSHYRSEIPDYIDEAVCKSLAVNPDDRYADAGDFLRDIESCIEKFKKDTIENQVFNFEDEEEDYRNYILNDSIEKAFRLAKCENKLNEAIEILEHEILRDYDIRKCYSHVLRIWKSKRPDVKLVSQAFTVNLRGTNYELACDCLKEAIAYNPNFKNKYGPYIELWTILSDLKKHGNLIKAVLSLEDLMQASNEIHDEYINVINTLRTYSADEILNESLRLADLNSLDDAAKLMEFAAAADIRISAKFSYKLSLLKQNMKIDFTPSDNSAEHTIDYAIDLGTTDSIISYYNHGNPVIIKNHITGKNFTPSAILIDGDDNIFVGEKARNAIIENSNDAVSEFKNNMGFSIPFKFDKSSQIMLPEELSAEVLKDLRKSVYCQTGEKMEHVVITVPANSNPIKTKAVNDAAELAGFRTHNLLLEPIAVAIAYGLYTSESDNVWMIYDLGGATFNVTLIKDDGGEIQNDDTIGVDTLGGNLFDWMIVDEIFVPIIARDLNLDDFRRNELKYSREFSRLKKASEGAKVELSYQDESQIVIRDLFEGYDFEYFLKREEFKEIIRASVMYSLRLCNDLLDRNSLTSADISKIILAGGSSLSPIVRELIAEEFDIPMEFSIDPLTVVAKGAAIYAGSLEKPAVEGNSDKFSLILAPHRNGIAGRVFTADSKFSYLGYCIEFINPDYSKRVSINIDGTFKVSLESNGGYVINIYDGDGNPVIIDEKSPDSIRFTDDNHGFEMNIEFFKKRFASSLSNGIGREDLTAKYNGLINDFNDLKDHYSLNEFYSEDILNYLLMLMDILAHDLKAINQVSIYIDYLTKRFGEIKRDLDIAVLVDNIENKLSVIKENDYFDIEDIQSDFKSAAEKKDIDKLNGIHTLLIEKYVALNRNDVITACFFNLRYEGIFTKNQALADSLFENAFHYLNNSDYGQLFNIVSQLYQLDERD